MIDKATWDSIVVLSEDVAVRTSNYHGTVLMQLHDTPASCRWRSPYMGRR
jgi:hypothetical protein